MSRATVKAFCAQEFEQSVRRAAGVQPSLSPPIDVRTFQPAALSKSKLLYIKLHGLAHEGAWYGSGWTTACTKYQLARCYLEKTVVFAACCFLPESPMLDALFQAGARAVVAGHGENYGGKALLLSSDVLGLYFRRAITAGLSPRPALGFAKALLAWRGPRWQKEDALAFEIFYPKGSRTRGKP